MKKFYKRPFWWALTYGVALTAFTGYTLLHTFVIPQVERTVVEAPTQAEKLSNANGGSGTVSNHTETDSSTGTDGTAADNNAAAEGSAATGDGTAAVDSSAAASDGTAAGDNASAEGSAATGDGTASDSSAAASDSTASDSGAATGDGTAADSSAATGDDTAAGSSTDAGESSEPVITDSSYTDDHIRINISKVREYDTDVYVADVQVSSTEYLQAAFANNQYGRNIKETTSDMAVEHGAILAINGDYYGFRDEGIVFRNGVLYRDTAADGDALVIRTDGSMEIEPESSLDTGALEGSDVWQVLSFGPSLLENGSVTVGENEEVGQAMTSNPRTAVGMISPLHYVFLVSDGRTNDNAGLSLYQLAQVMQEQGCTVAYNLDGGGSSTMVFNGNVLNNPTSGKRSGGERQVSDIVYIG